MDVITSGFSPNHFVVRRGIPVKWVINGKQVTSCNHRIIVPSLNLEFDVKKGLQTIEFTPTKAGVIPWSCWMGMLHGDFEVIEPPAAPAQPEIAANAPAQPEIAVNAPTQPAPQPPRPAFQTIEMDVIASGYSPNHFILSRGIPVKWVINGKEVTSCNHRIIVPSLNLEFDVKKGLQTIEFTPTKAGIIPWSCWMGMLHGDFEVIEPPPAAPAQPEIAANAPAQPEIAVNPPAESAKAIAPPSAVSPSAPAVASSYTIASGDTLRGVAAKLFHDARRWREIAAVNPGLDARRLRPGQVIKLPGPPLNAARADDNPTMSLLLKSGEQGSLHKITASMFGNVTQDEEIGRKVNPVAFVRPELNSKRRNGPCNALILLILGSDFSKTWCHVCMLFRLVHG